MDDDKIAIIRANIEKRVCNSFQTRMCTSLSKSTEKR